ncbi:putative NAD(P)-binding protein [Flavobacterium cauense R2A-7]|uniref:Putative NAD(P)-binding protein n=1 Tax=Flavobacterium cauense R2A-7 TaxID=1341154 RepID=A0A562LZ89_9FLAO|nr:NAD(P)/FAD-dependent oxidoreductase [Flavobacterium cauense]KGO80950.1 twin-arginine translocation pathway signal protein [Flavobacterium cauense R2A-7]TWI12863.1 putative NAD(P)-binding protein [Flavobacterium cauense R2A-7]
MRNGENYNSRRTFLKGIAASLLLLPVLQSCKEKVIALLIRLSGTNHILGHRLWVKNFPKPTRQIQIPYLIIGGGISGLSAARQFTKKGISEFLVLELENYLGGNSSNGENQYSKFPLGAHYLPLPNFHDKTLLQFLEEEKIILGYDAKGFPEFDEAQLTFSPQERLFYKNDWQEGLVPKYGNSHADENAFQVFFSKMDYFRETKGADGKYLFDIPLGHSSNDEQTLKLDNITMKQWLDENKLTAKPLIAYIDYCCRDDFGLGIDFVSAWAGIHYFAGRKHNATSDGKENVLTWPEGNARLASHLKKYSEGKTLKNHLAYEVKIEGNKTVVHAFDDMKKESVEIIADKVILATPQFINQYLLENRKHIAREFHYAPWLLATLTVSDLTDNYSYPLCWDNVIHGSKGLGYIYDQHQSVQQVQSKKVITYYFSFSSPDIRKTRRALYKQKKEYWKQMVFDDLKTAHPDIEGKTEEISIRLLGHGMISPVPGFLFGAAKNQAGKSIGNKIFFAHSDLAGISIFEEAFHQGINVVNTILDGTTLDS